MLFRSAQPITLLAHFTPRQQQDSSQELLSEARRKPVLDPEGSLIDADMGAYYTWINQQRLSGAEQSHFLAWFEGQNQAVAISPSLPPGTVSPTSMNIEKIIATLG